MAKRGEVLYLRLRTRRAKWDLAGVSGFAETLRELYMYSDTLRRLDEKATEDGHLESQTIEENFYYWSIRRLPEPEVRLTVMSPLSMELVGETGQTATVLGFLYWILKNPEKLTEFYPSLRRSWHDGQLRADLAKERRKRLMELGGGPMDLGVGGRGTSYWLEPRERESSNEDEATSQDND